MKLWRIAAETRAFPADDLGGMGAASHPGRWNDHGEVVVYCATSISLAVLETAAHIDDGGFPQNRFLVEIDVPGGVWSRREEVQASALPAAWSAIPAGRASVRFGVLARALLLGVSAASIAALAAGVVLTQNVRSRLRALATGLAGPAAALMVFAGLERAPAPPFAYIAVPIAGLSALLAILGGASVRSSSLRASREDGTG